MTGKSDPLAGGFIANASVDHEPIPPITPTEAHAAQLTLCEQAVLLGYGAPEAREALAAVGLL